MSTETKKESKLDQSAEGVVVHRIVSDLGRDFMDGVVLCVVKYICIGFAILLPFSMLRNWLAWDTDDSDKDGWHRSGLRVHTDAKTGIQYLSDGHGGLVRREYR